MARWDPYTKTERSAAALFCSIAASNAPLTTYDAAEHLTGSRHGIAAGLADYAWSAARRLSIHVERAAVYAEAEAMIRTGEI